VLGLALALSVGFSSKPSWAKDDGLSTPKDGESDEARGAREKHRLEVGRYQSTLGVGLGLGGRWFSYSDALGKNLAAYQVPAVPMATLSLDVYPAAASGIPILQDLGLRGRVSRAVGLASKTSDGTELDASWTRYGGEVHGRWIPQSNPTWQAGAGVGVDVHHFNIKSAGPLPVAQPSVDTASLRVGFDGRMPVVGPLALGARVAYLLPFEKGDVYNRFRDRSVQGMDLEAFGAWRLGPGLEARATLQYTRYFARFRPIPGDEFVAGGALDQLVQINLGVAYGH
jgi:hypothetical protein